MSLGEIPEIETLTYAELCNRDNTGWYSDTMKEDLSGKLVDTNEEYCPMQKVRSNFIRASDECVRLTVQMVRKKN